MTNAAELCEVGESDAARLEERLLSIGGKRVARRPDPHVGILLERGQVWRKRVRMHRMVQNECHGNTASLWGWREIRGDNRFQIMTGWALTKDDDCWRQHTWGLDDDRIIETTLRRSVYFGFVLTQKEAAEFYLQNAPEAQTVLKVVEILRADKKPERCAP